MHAAEMGPGHGCPGPRGDIGCRLLCGPVSGGAGLGAWIFSSVKWGIVVPILLVRSSTRSNTRCKYMQNTLNGAGLY